MADVFSGSYSLRKSDNFDDFLKEMGAGYAQRVVLRVTAAEITINKIGDEWHMAVKSAVSKKAFKFRMGEEFDGTNIVGAKVRNMITVDGNKWTQVQSGEQVVTTVYEFGKKQLTITMTVKDVTAVRIFERL